MPVVDLADYLGMPQQAPADPLFYQNQRKAAIDREMGDFNQRAGARDQLYRLQRQAPVLQAQQAQNAYDEVAQQANDLRMKQEIEAQVERAANELAGGNLNPESDDFAVKYRDLATRNPLAMSDSRFRQVAGLYEGQNQNYQQTRAAQAQEAARQAQEAERIAAASRQYRRDAIAKGVPAADIPLDATDMDIASMVAKVSKAGRGGSDPEERRLRTRADIAEKRFRAISDSIQASDEQIAQAEKDYMDALDNWSQYDPSAGVSQQTNQQQASGRTLGGTGIPIRPKEQAVVQPAAQIPVTPEGQIDIDKIPFGEIDKTIAKVQEQSKAQEEVAKAWNDAQMDLEKKLEKLYPGNIGNTNYAKLARFAKAVLNGERISDPKASGAVDETGAPLTKSVAESALEELGLPFAGEAFVEPGKSRQKLFGLVGDQRVPYNQLLEVWAKNYLQRAPTTVVPQVRAIPAEKVQKADEFLNSFQK